MEIATESVRADRTTARPILNLLQERIGPQKFNAWFRHGTRVTLEDGRAKVAVPNLFIAKWIETHYQADIAQAVEEHTGAVTEVVVSVDSMLAGELRRNELDTQAEMVQKASEGRSREFAPAAALRYRLEDFVVGSSNKLAYSAGVAMASGPCAFGHLFIHGPCGVGKTHLLQGICSTAGRMMKDGAPIRVRYVTGEQFTNEFIASIRKKTGGEFRAKYRNLDVLAIDDVHFLSAKKATQEEFLHTFNAIQSSGKRIILASDAHPRMVGEINEQLISRFVSGMVVKIEAPDPALRLEILRRRAAVMKLRVDAEVLQYISAHIRGSIRELEGALVKVAAVAALNECPPTVALVNEALADHLARTDSALTLGDIEAAVGAFFGLTTADLHSSRRTRTVSVARMITMFLARRHTAMSFPEIGRFMGKNHSSVVLACQRMEAFLQSGDEVKWQTPMGTKSLPAPKLLAMLTDQFA